MNIQRFAIALGLGLGLALALLWLLGSSTTPVTAAPVLSPAEGPALSPEQDPAERPLSDATPIHYVATSGTDDGDCSTPAGACRTIQYAVDRAGEGDEVRIATGVYTDINNYGGRTQVVYIDKTVTVRGGYTTTNWNTSNPISYPTTLDAQRQGHVLYIIGDIRPTVEGLYITGGDGGWSGGGGVYVVTAMATLDSNQISNNIADNGGGLYLKNSAARLGGNIIASNTAYDDGGGLYLLQSNATLEGNTISNNKAYDDGGGLFIAGSDATLSRNTISSNTADKFGGGLLALHGDPTLNANLIISNIGNRYGGGLVLVDGAGTLTNDIIADNSDSGLAISGSSPRLMHTTIARNRGVCGVLVSTGASDDNVAMINTVLVSHTVGIYVLSGRTATLEATLWGTGTWANLTDWDGSGTIITGTANIWGDPDFVNPDAGDYHIGPDSGARDAGADAGITTDMDGEPRPSQSPDLGADEYWPPGALKYVYLPVVMRRTQ